MRPYRLPLLTALLLLAAGRAPAVPLYYAFQGEVVYTNVAVYALGQTVRYTFLVDQERNGNFIDGIGTVRIQEDMVEERDWYRLSFYASYVGGDAMAADNPGSDLRETWNMGVDQVHYDEIFSALRGSNADPGGFDLLDIWSADMRFGDWGVGKSVMGQNFVQNGFGELNSTYSSALTLTAITDYNPLTPAAVPEPSTFALFGFGALALGIASLRARLLPKRS